MPPFSRRFIRSLAFAQDMTEHFDGRLPAHDFATISPRALLPVAGIAVCTADAASFQHEHYIFSCAQAYLHGGHIDRWRLCPVGAHDDFASDFPHDFGRLTLGHELRARF